MSLEAEKAIAAKDEALRMAEEARKVKMFSEYSCHSDVVTMI